MLKNKSMSEGLNYCNHFSLYNGSVIREPEDGSGVMDDIGCTHSLGVWVYRPVHVKEDCSINVLSFVEAVGSF